MLFLCPTLSRPENGILNIKKCITNRRILSTGSKHFFCTISYLLPPTSYLLRPTLYLLPPTSYLLPLRPTSYLLPPISYLPTPYLLPPTSYLLPPTSPPPTSYLLPPTSYPFSPTGPEPAELFPEVPKGASRSFLEPFREFLLWSFPEFLWASLGLE